MNGIYNKLPRACAVSIIALWINACQGGDWVDMPLRLVDESGKDIDYFCIAPLYGKTSGVGWGVEDTGRSRDSRRYLMWPTIMRPGDKYVDKVRKKKSFGFPALFTSGENIFPIKMLFIGKGYAPVLWDSYIDHSKVVTVVLRYGSSNNAIDVLVSRVDNGGAIRRLYDVREGVEIVNNYTDADRDIIRSCLLR